MKSLYNGKNRILNKFQLYILRKKGYLIGKNCHISIYANLGTEPYLITIGDNVRIEANVFLKTNDHSSWTFHQMGIWKNQDIYGPIWIGDYTRIGTGSVIMPGVTIGRNCIILENSLVTTDIPNNAIVAGVPAILIDNIESYAQKCLGKCTTDIPKNSQKRKRQILMREFNLDI